MPLSHDDILLRLSDFEPPNTIAPEVILSMKRNIGISINPDFRVDLATAKHDVVVEAICVVRIPSWLKAFIQQNSDISQWEVMEAIHVNAARVLDLYIGAATALYAGELKLYSESTGYTHYPLPMFGDTTLITVFGNIVDPTGRVTSLTVTDRATALSVSYQISAFAGLYDYATTLSSGVDYNYGGETPYRGTVFGDSVKPINSKMKAAAAVPPAPTAPNSQAVSTEIHKLATFTELQQVKNGETFQVSISRIALNDNGMVINGFNAQGVLSRTLFFFIPQTSDFGVFARGIMDEKGTKELVYPEVDQAPVLQAIKTVARANGKWETTLNNAIVVK